MKKYFKTLIAACIAVCLSVCVGLFATACTEDKPDSYTVTVTADGKGVAGVLLQFCPVGEMCILGTTDADGNAVFKFKEDGRDFSNATEFEIHVVSGLPNGYTTEYMGDNAKIVNVKDGYSATIELKKIQSVAFNCTFSASEKIKDVQPAITVAGFYEIRSASSFNFVGENETVENITSLFVFLNRGDTVKLGAYGSTYDYSFYAVFASFDHKHAEYLTASAGSAVVLNLSAGEKVTFKNPEPSAADRRDGSVISVSGDNAKFTAGGKDCGQSFMIGSGKSFEMTTANGAAGVAVAAFNGVSASAPIVIGTECSFEVELIESMSLENNKPVNKLGWPFSYYNLLVELPDVSDGTDNYKITVTSSVAGDIPTVGSTMMGYDSGNVSVALAVSKKEADDFYTFAVESKNLTHTHTFRIEISPSGDFSSLKEGNKITYKVLIEKV